MAADCGLEARDVVIFDRARICIANLAGVGGVAGGGVPAHAATRSRCVPRPTYESRLGSLEAIQRQRQCLTNLGMPEEHSITTGSPSPCIYPVHLALATRGLSRYRGVLPGDACSPGS